MKNTKLKNFSLLSEYDFNMIFIMVFIEKNKSKKFSF